MPRNWEILKSRGMKPDIQEFHFSPSVQKSIARWVRKPKGQGKPTFVYSGMLESILHFIEGLRFGFVFFIFRNIICFFLHQESQTKDPQKAITAVLLFNLIDARHS